MVVPIWELQERKDTHSVRSTSPFHGAYLLYISSTTASSAIIITTWSSLLTKLTQRSSLLSYLFASLRCQLFKPFIKYAAYIMRGSFSLDMTVFVCILVVSKLKHSQPWLIERHRNKVAKVSSASPWSSLHQTKLCLPPSFGPRFTKPSPPPPLGPRFTKPSLFAPPPPPPPRGEGGWPLRIFVYMFLFPSLILIRLIQFTCCYKSDIVEL